MTGFRRYMSKSQRACDFCRSRRAACRIENSLPCRLCRLHARECTFQDGPAVRKARRTEPTATEGVPDMAPEFPVQPGVQSPQAVMAFDDGPQYGGLDHTFHAADQNGQDEALFNGGNWELAHATIGQFATENHLSDDPVQGGADALLDGRGLDDFWADIPMAANLEPNALDDALISHFVGPTGEQDPNLLRRYRFDEKHELWFKKLGTRVVSEAPNPTLWMLTLPSSTDSEPGSATSPSISEERASLEALVTPDVGERLILLFMKFVHPLFPIFSHRALPTPSESPIHLLAAIYLIADRFFGHDDYLCIQVVYNQPQPRKLFGLAWASFQQNLHKASINLIQTAILLLLAPLTDPLEPELSLRWSLVGTLVSMSETVGLHLDPTTWSIPLHQISIRRRLSWVVFTLDTWFALTVGRPTRISGDNWMIDRLEETDLESTTTETADFSLTLQFAKITLFVKQVLQKLFTLKASETLTTNFRQVLDTARPLLVDLSAWHNELPASTASAADKTQSSEAPHQRYQLKLAYYAARLSIIRALLRTFENPEVDSTLKEADRDEFQEARKRCREAAKTCTMAMVDFVSSLSGRDLEQFWPSWSSTIFSMMPYMALLLLATSRDINEAGQFKFLLNKARRVLRTQSRVFDTIRLASLRMDAHFWKGFDNALFMDSRLGSTFEEIVETPWSTEPDRQ